MTTSILFITIVLLVRPIPPCHCGYAHSEPVRGRRMSLTAAAWGASIFGAFVLLALAVIAFALHQIGPGLSLVSAPLSLFGMAWDTAVANTSGRDRRSWVGNAAGMTAFIGGLVAPLW